MYEKSQNMETVLEIAKTQRKKEEIIELIGQRQNREEIQQRNSINKEGVTKITEKSTQEEPENRETMELTEKRTPRIEWNILGIVGLIIAILQGKVTYCGSNFFEVHTNLGTLVHGEFKFITISENKYNCDIKFCHLSFFDNLNTA